ncbi:neuronal acetylcholine receptor subunit alpha-10-like [Acanthaster planci]|uniref:Neuronal acetylcholine receptor subunit alpha-10-like n=1 Tax=Acanthaster planci TaxID=133434 RepID=A0A8B7XT85_ACAPL|nr:neuronal acetylcholine receptor subunit alpha-10-like [Acanthaster planci]
MAEGMIVLVTLTIIRLACGSTEIPPTLLPGSEEKSIVANLLRGYGSRVIRPLRNSSQSVNVNLRLLISQIVDFDEPRQQLTINAWQKLSWHDDFLVWNPDDYGGQDIVHVLQSEIWIPRIVLLENVNYDFPSFDETELIVSSDGSVNWYAPAMFQFSCKVYVKRFPFDVQHCNMTFMAWAYDISALNFSYLDDEDTKQYIFAKNGVWNLIRVDTTREKVKYVCCEHPYTQVIYELTFQRASLAYIFSILIPSILLAMLTLMVFCVPPASGEKISLGMTNLLAFVLFQQLIAGNMPPIGDETPILTMFIFCMVVVGCASIFASVYVLCLFNTYQEKLVTQRVIRLMAYLYGPCKGRVTWQAVALKLDRAMFVLFLVTTVILILLSFIALMLSTDKPN